MATKRSPARARQQHLFHRKGQLSGMMTILDGIMYDTSLSPLIRNDANDAYFRIRHALMYFNREVGWPVKKADGVVEIDI